MRYKTLGRSGLWTSEWVLGTMTFADGADEATSRQLFARARDLGVNHFDCADLYANGESERILGRLIQGDRQALIVTTKAYFPTHADPNARGASRHHLLHALDASLRRLNTDYVDIFYLHRFDPHTPLEESLVTLDDLVRAGKVRYLGLSNFAAWQVVKALAIQSHLRLSPAITVIQPMYNLLKRQAEVELLPMAQSEGLGVLTYSPLAAGMLTGKYLAGTDTTGRIAVKPRYRQRYGVDAYAEAVQRFVAFATARAIDPVALAIAWSATHPAVTAPILGARTVDQLERAAGAFDLSVTEELRQALSELTPTPPPATDRNEETLPS